MNTPNYFTIHNVLLGITILLLAAVGHSHSEFVGFKVEKPKLIMPQDYSKVAFDGEIYFSDSDPSWDWDDNQKSQPEPYKAHKEPFRNRPVVDFQNFRIGGIENDWTGLHSIRFAAPQVPI